MPASSDTVPAPERVVFSGAAAAPGARWRQLGLGLILIAVVYVAGAPELGAPWIQGDEYIFIVGNPDVNPIAAGTVATPLKERLAHILTHVHDDLYQPIPILTYAIEWGISGGDPLRFRRTDVLLHGINGLLVWWVLTWVLRRVAGPAARHVSMLAWTLALVWALHPMLVTAYASDMGRTHLLAAMFSLLALAFYLRTVTSGRWAYFSVALLALLLGMLCKPMPGWVLLALVVEAAAAGWRRAWLSPRVWIVGILCAGFAVSTLWTSRQAGLIEDASKGLFGDPVARSALAVWIYARNLIAPAWLAFWYPPDPRTGWAYPLVWLGLLLAAASVAHAIRAWRQPRTRAVTVGWAWCWALLLPVLGLVGAREVAAEDRYFYQPLAGIALVVGVTLLRLQTQPRPVASWHVLGLAGAVVTAAMLLWDLPQCRIARGTIRRATRLVTLNPTDPRALEALAQAYDFSRNHPIPADDLAKVPADSNQFTYFTRRTRETLLRAAEAENLAYYFPGPEDRGPFHRRLSYRFLLAGDAHHSLAQAEAARTLRPDDFMTWKRLAHALQALGRLDDALAAYTRCEELLPDMPATRAAHFTDLATLLMFDLGRGTQACPRFAAALATGHGTASAKLGMALCMIRDREGRYGTGAEGYRLISEVLAADPGNVRAGLVLAEYHLRSWHWEQAQRVYDAILRDYPAHYAALRGLHEVCLQTGQMDEAVLAWGDALQQEPDRREFQSYFVWALALAEDPAAVPAADDLLAKEPNNPFGCFARMVHAVRHGELTEAVAWIERADEGAPIPQAREFERAAAALQLGLDRGRLPEAARLAQAAVCLARRAPPELKAEAPALIDAFVKKNADSPWTGLAEQLRERLSDAGAAP